MPGIIPPTIWMGRPFEITIYKEYERDGKQRAVQLFEDTLPVGCDIYSRIWHAIRDIWDQVESDGFYIRIGKKDMTKPCLLLRRHDNVSPVHMRIYKKDRLTLQDLPVRDASDVIGIIQRNLAVMAQG